MKIIIEKNHDKLSLTAARIISSQIITTPDSVLGLPTGKTPIDTYEKLVKLYDRGILDYSEITTFNLDEYMKLSKDHEKSFHRYMEAKLFSRVNIKQTNTFLPNGQTDNPVKEGNRYEKLIDKKGGIDLMILGVGTNGHIGFNEPGTPWDSQTRPVKLTKETRKGNFSDLKSAPKKALTMGIKSIMQSKKILLLASGKRKTRAITELIEGKVTKEWPASILQLHPQTTVLLDKDAARGISEE